MIFNRKNLIILLILLGAFLVIGGVCAQGDGFSLAGAAKKVSPTKTVTVKIYNFKPGVLWAPKATKFKNGDAMITYSLIDLFRLKYINDNYGHKYGDKYIVKVSELISKEIDSEDMLFRIGGDEFVILSKSLKKDDMLLKLNTVNKKLRIENLGLKIPFPLNINYGVIEGNWNLDKFYTEADEELSHHKASTYKKLKLDRRK